jgi:hypothetical protein
VFAYFSFRPFLTILTYYYFNLLLDEEKGGGGDGGLVTAALAAQSNLTLHIDIYRVEQVIRNLITNAVRYNYSAKRFLFLCMYVCMYVCMYIWECLILSDYESPVVEVHPKRRRSDCRHILRDVKSLRYSHYHYYHRCGRR